MGFATRELLVERVILFQRHSQIFFTHLAQTHHRCGRHVTIASAEFEEITKVT